MHGAGWLSRRLHDVPPGDSWLGESERLVQRRFVIEQRRRSWRLGRYTAKAALAEWLDLPAERIEVLAAEDGAPEAWHKGKLLPVSISISHRGDRAIAVVTDAPGVVGCDLELVEPRSPLFIEDWLAPNEQAAVASACDEKRALMANLLWSAKESAAKVRREGLRLDLRAAVVTAETTAPDDCAWHRLRVDWEDRCATSGWWRTAAGWVMTVTGTPEPCAPRPLPATRATDI